jgi:antitoxin PrlF
MAAVIERVGTITEKGQITVPKPVREALGVGYGGRVVFRVDEHGVSVHRLEEEEGEDPVLAGFLTFLAADMQRRPQAITAFPQALAARLATLSGGTETDLDEEIDGPVSL